MKNKGQCQFKASKELWPILNSLIICNMNLSGGFGASNIKISNLELVRTRLAVFQSQFGIRTSAIRVPLNYSGLVISQRSHKARILWCGSSSETKCKYFY